MNDISQKIKHHIDLFKEYSDEKLLSITLQYAPQLEHHIAARLLLEERKSKAQNKVDAEILKSAKGANRWAMYAVIVALLSLLFLVIDWTCKYFHSANHTQQKIEKVTEPPTKQSPTIDTSGTSNEKHQLPPKQLKTKSKLSEK